MQNKSTFLKTLVLSAGFLAGSLSANAQCHGGSYSLPVCYGFKTYSQNSWGATPCGNNAAAYLNSNFATAFPTGLTIGCINTLKLTSAAAALAFLPQTGTSGALSAGLLTNPTSNSYHNPLAGHLAASVLNVQFDLTFPNFGSSSTNLKDLIIGAGTFQGWTVSQVIAEANRKIGGCASAYSYSQMCSVLSDINDNYENGCSSDDFLRCPTICVTNVLCQVSCFGGNNGSISLTISGGNSPYTYLWSNGATTKNITGLTAGTYTLTIKDSNGQNKVVSFTITQPLAAIASSFTQVNVNCFGATTGSIDLSVSGGTSPYTYLWNNGATSQDRSGLAAGTYSVVIKDAKNCTKNVSVIITGPSAAISASAVATGISCFGGANGSVNLTVSGGTAPYTYAWSNSATTEDLTNVAAGTYNVTVTDFKGCTKTASATVQGPSSAVSASAVATGVSCFNGANGSVNLTATGGTAPYTYLWSNSAITEDLANVAAGTYSVVVTDFKGCTKSAATIVASPSALSASAVATDVSCFGSSNGAVNLSVSGGTSPYTFAWNNMATSEDLTGLAAGAYNVTVTDFKGCTTMASALVGSPDVLSATFTKQDAVCNGGSTGSINLSVSGGSTPYGFVWSNAATAEDISGLSAGNYNVLITDGHGCTKSLDTSIGHPDALQLSLSVTPSLECLCNGTASAFSMGGSLPYSYSWSDATTGTDHLSGICAGTHTSVIVTDGHGCQKTSEDITTVYQAGCTGFSVESYAQGKRNNNTPVEADRSNPLNVLGIPDWSNTPGGFYSLGFGGHIIIKMDGGLVDGPGNDLKISETTFDSPNPKSCAAYPERARIFVSQDLLSWYDLGEICQDGEVDIAPLSCIMYVKILDVSNPLAFGSQIVDGYDVDGIQCINHSTAGARLSLPAGNSIAAVKAGKAHLDLFPNPTENRLTVTIGGVTEGQELGVKIFDMLGQEVRSLSVTPNATTYNLELECESMNSGVYFVSVKGSNYSQTKKFVRK